MAIDITIPRLGWDMTHGVFAGWLKKDGDAVAVGDALFSLESDKATQDVEAIDAGTLRIPPDGPRPGDRLSVGSVIGRLVAGNEPPAPAAPIAGPAVRRLARELAIDLAQVAGTGPTGRITAADVRGPHQPAREPAISPRARRLAKLRGVDWRKLKGGGRTGRIRERDVRAAISAAAAPPPPAPADRQPLSPTRKVIAERMLHSAHATAPVTLTTTVDATELVRLRQQFKASGAPAPSYVAFVAKFAADALAQHPLLNARLEGDELVLQAAIHIGIAVDTDAGLLVPVLRDVGSLGVRQIAERSRDLIDRARSRRLQAAEMQGGTFTISNLGSFGIDAFTPIINYPESAILGLGRIRRMPVVVGKRIVARDQVTLSLTFDHRLADGAPAARFLQQLGRQIENPVPHLIP